MSWSKELERQRAFYQRKIDAIDILLESPDGNSGDDDFINNDAGKNFPKDASYIEQITHIITSANRFLHNSEITAALEKHSNKKSVNLSRRVSAVLSKAKEGSGNLTSITVGASKRNSFWGSQNWLDKNGDPLTEHMYDPSLVVMRRTKGINI